MPGVWLLATAYRSPSTTPPDAAAAKLADRQHGLIRADQLRAAGIGHQGITRRLAAGRLTRIHRGVYAWGHRRLTQQGLWMAAVLACGPGAALSHRSAGAGWAIRATWRGGIDVTAPTQRGRGLRGIDHHRCRLHVEDVTVLDGIPITTVARTLLDLAEVLDERALRRAVDEAIRHDRFDLGAIDATLARADGRHGQATLRRVLDDLDLRSSRTRRELEARAFELIRRARLPRPEVNVLVEGHEVDLLWRDARLVVELDGRGFHSDPTAFERDRRRDGDLQLAGYRVLRLTWRQVTREPAWVAERITALLAMTGRRSTND